MTNEEAIEMLSQLSYSDERISEALTHAIEVLRADTWMPIDSAPRDGTRILLHNKYGAGSGHFDKVWHCHFAFNQGESPTHWRPLPKPPEKGE